MNQAYRKNYGKLSAFLDGAGKLRINSETINSNLLVNSNYVMLSLQVFAT